MISQADLKTILHYDPETGLFTRLHKNGRRWRIGDVAGCKARGYIVIRTSATELYRAHRLAWLYVQGMCPKFIDHINGVKDDNRIANLRPTNKAGNAYNSPTPANNTSGFKGVSFHAQSGKWAAKTQFRGRYIHLGLFDVKEDAAAAYRQFILANHGEFARA